VPTSPFQAELPRLEYVFRRGNIDLSKLKRHTLLSNATMTIWLSKILGVELVRGAREPKVILVNRGWRVESHFVLDAKPDSIFPSDHFGVMADLILGP
jgi:hypothetical protein